jgi:hypothetical protein
MSDDHKGTRLLLVALRDLYCWLAGLGLGIAIFGPIAAAICLLFGAAVVWLFWRELVRSLAHVEEIERRFRTPKDGE